MEFWLPLLQAPLPLVLQKQTNHAVRSTACDCLADIGPLTFEQLPVSIRKDVVGLENLYNIVKFTVLCCTLKGDVYIDLIPVEV